MRFARGTLGVGSLYVCSFAVMALPGFLLFLCDFKKKKKRYLPPGILQHTDVFFSPGSHAQNAAKKNNKKKQLDKLQSLALYRNIYCGCGKLSCKYSIHTVINCIYISGLFTSCISK